MYNIPSMYQCPYNPNTPMHNAYNMFQCPYFANTPVYNPDLWNQFPNQYLPYTNQAKTDYTIILKDYGPNPFVVDIEEATKQNNNFRLALWTGKYLQLTLMSINVGEDIGLEIHPNLDQFIRIEEGQGIVKMGDRQDKLDFQANVSNDFAFIIPAGKWHNLINTSNKPLKLYSIYAPPQHPLGTVHKTKEEAEAAEEGHDH
ncbi:MAG TPA: cupin domain-containing protein [Pseudobacteroides sp.]|uniref:cupin domain-containing protein n=1 Tax=Pseudobacteroides sp. TaxID=1968840 RepID=UPI002F93E04D